MPEWQADPESAAWVLTTTTAIARGDREALGRFYQVWFDRCFVLARNLTRRDEALCLDIVQDTMLRVIRSLRPIGTHEELSAWMIRATHSAALDLLRRESRRLRREATKGAEQAVSAVNATDERIAWVLERLRELPAEDSALVALRLARGASLESVGAAAGLTGAAAHGRVRRALARLKRWAKEGGNEL